MRFRNSLLLLSLCCLTAAPAAAQDSAAPGAGPQASVVNTGGAPGSEAAGIKKYLLGPGDILDLRVYNEPQFNGPLVVDDEGNIAVPFIETPIRAQCRNDREIRADIIKALSKYLNKPQVNLRLTEAKSRPRSSPRPAATSRPKYCPARRRRRRGRSRVREGEAGF